MGKMKKAAGMFVMTLTLVFAGTFFTPRADMACVQAAKPSVSRILKLYKQKKYKQAQAMANKLPANANEKCVGSMSKKMKKAYRKKVKSFDKKVNWTSSKPYMWDYYLTDINKDKKPELLIVYGSCEADVQVRVYTYKNGKAVLAGKTYCTHSSLYAYPGGNGFVMMAGHMLGESVYKVTLKNGKLKTTRCGSRIIGETEGYLRLPYALKGHVHWTESGRYFDYDDF